MHDPESRTLNLRQPRTLVFGSGCVAQLTEDLAASGLHHIFVVCARPIRGLVDPIIQSLADRGLSTSIDDSVDDEPGIVVFEKVLAAARSAPIDAVVGIGGGSVLDVAKLVAALLHSDQSARDVFGIGKLEGRKTFLACLPTTAGTGSEVSPNAILLDEAANLKKGAVSPWLVPDAAYVDPTLTYTVPPDVTTATGLDALTHCIEAYANRFAHPMIDLFALKGIELISAHLEAAYRDGSDMEARSALALGSLYGGLCLGPVNTGAVHALAYPLGGAYHIPHGVSNAILLPAVFEFNMPVWPQRYARVAQALGCHAGNTDVETARLGVERIRQLSENCGLRSSLTHWGVAREAVTRLAQSALTVTRLLKNNPRELTQKDAETIYRGLL
jgi:alcohol dehydrogenase class IV